MDDPKANIRPGAQRVLIHLTDDADRRRERRREGGRARGRRRGRRRGGVGGGRQGGGRQVQLEEGRK